MAWFENLPGGVLPARDSRSLNLEQARYDILYRQDPTFARRLASGEFGAYSRAELEAYLGPDALRAEADRIASHPSWASGGGSELSAWSRKVLPVVVTAFLAWAVGGAVAGSAGSAGSGAAAGEGAASGAGAAAGGEVGAGAAAAGGEGLVFDYSYLDALEAGDAFYGGEVFVPAAAAEVAPAVAPSIWDKVIDAGTELAKKYAAAEIASRFAPDAAQRDISSRVPPARGVPVSYVGQGGDALGSLVSPAGLKVLLSLGGLVLIGAVAYKVVKK